MGKSSNPNLKEDNVKEGLEYVVVVRSPKLNEKIAAESLESQSCWQ